MRILTPSAQTSGWFASVVFSHAIRHFLALDLVRIVFVKHLAANLC